MSLVEQPFGLLRFYDSKLKRVHERNGRCISPGIYPNLWDLTTRLCQFRLHTDEEFDTIIGFKLISSDEETEYDLIADVSHINKIVAEARNKTFNAWLYYADQNLSSPVANGVWFIEITIQNAELDEEIWYSNEFIISGYCAEYQVVYDSFTTKPSNAIAQQQNLLVKTLVDTGVWTKMDVFYILAGHINDDGESLINWINPGTFDSTLVNAPNFVALEGFTGDGLTSYINSNYIPSIDAINLSLNSASIGVYSRTDVSNGRYDMGSDIGGNINSLKFSSLWTGLGFFLRVNTASSSFLASILNSLGFYIINRVLSTHQEGYKNKIREINGARVSTGVTTNEVFICASNNNGVASHFSTRQLSLAFIGGGLTQSDVNTFTDAFEAYMDSNGKGVIT